MRVLVTGATGFVGTHLTEACLRRGFSVLGFSREGKWRQGVLPYVEREVALQIWDVTKPCPPRLIEIARAFAPDALIHLAAISLPVDCGGVDPNEAAINTNVRGTEHALELAEMLPSLSSFMLTSSCHVYETDPSQLQVVDEKWPKRPANGYGWTKLWAEELVDRHRSHTGFRRLVVRGFQQTGPWQPARLIVPEWLEMAARGDDPLVVRCLNTVLDLADIRDTVCMQLELLERKAEGIFNLASGFSTSGSDLIEALQKCLGRKLTVNSLQPGPRFNPIADLSRIQQVIGTVRHRPLLHTLQDMWATLDSQAAEPPIGCVANCL